MLSIPKKLTSREGKITNRPTARAAARITATVMAMSPADLPSFCDSHFSNLVGSSISSPSSSALRVVIFKPPDRASTKAYTPRTTGQVGKVPFLYFRLF